ncbi:N-acetyl-gamma-glutamyl-phosphate reductase [Asticcacaulis benevestitus]|uniref:N-acetyl-gamma-glutamyl-phosphate reductase n=1 Tax=Asticcacaulis benevestitus DSM 16100 = ATCC BAA-896 TaxID=1121022 RepID=V4PXX7_9CAUL|nr:N-acetyl-gamma-glutamyl-phosphate reductase [Asticcacaulis benevestitus]ESQ93226.1 hypothetical protein ABENE_06675 [Asticcacaulis benevestitus DSM 16100 = ATCC BAA-896]
MSHKVFIDGEAGTTGLQIRERLEKRSDIELIRLSDDKRKDAGARKEALNSADAVILCLPDEAAIEAVSMIDNPDVRVIDASTAFRTDAAWTYGFPELNDGQRAEIAASKRISNPGCHATGFIALTNPLVEAGIIPSFFPITATSLTGYSGGGKSMIAEFEGAPEHGQDRGKGHERLYATGLAHKHLPEMTLYSGLESPPIFTPIVANFPQGLIVQVPLHLWALPDEPDIDAIRNLLTAHYLGEQFVRVANAEESEEAGAVHGAMLANTNQLLIHVFGNPDQDTANLVAVFDNLGKGASGAAVQNLNLVLGVEEGLGLV